MVRSTEEVVRLGFNVFLGVVTAAILVENIWSHYARHASFAGLAMCLDVKQRRAIYFADEHCREHEIEANMNTIGGILFNFVMVNLHIFAAIGIVWAVAAKAAKAAPESLGI
jgi:hypothetical protein